jgi:4-carboxymuconolactone decarboxylase
MLAAFAGGDQGMSRFDDIKLSTLTPAQQEAADEITAGKRGRVPPPFAALMPSPELCRRAAKLGEFLRFDTALGPRLSEIAILATGRFWTAQYEFWAHARLAREAGVAEAVISAIAEKRDPAPHMNDEEKLVYAVAKSLHEKHGLDDALYRRATDGLGKTKLVEVIGLCGYYTLVSMVLNTFEAPVPGGEVPLR